MIPSKTKKSEQIARDIYLINVIKKAREQWDNDHPYGVYMPNRYLANKLKEAGYVREVKNG